MLKEFWKRINKKEEPTARTAHVVRVDLDSDCCTVLLDGVWEKNVGVCTYHQAVIICKEYLEFGWLDFTSCSSEEITLD